MKRLLCLLVLISSGYGKDAPIVMYWPDQINGTLKLSFTKFQPFAAGKSQTMYLSDVIVENLTNKLIPQIVFDVYVTDKAGVRIGDGVLRMSNIGSLQQVKGNVQVVCMGVPAGFSLLARKEMLGPKTVPLKILSSPPGAKLTVDGSDAGETPVMVALTIGTHSLLLNKEGYAKATTSVEIAPEELPGGSITVDLGGMSQDAVELRDGTNILGDVLAITMTSVTIRVNGVDQILDRNRVKKILLVERTNQKSGGQDASKLN